MNFFSRQKTRTPAETVRALKENIVRLDSAGSGEGKKRVSSCHPHSSYAHQREGHPRCTAGYDGDETICSPRLTGR